MTRRRTGVSDVKARFLNEVTEGMRLEASLMLRSKELRIARNGDPYLWLEVSDRTGSMQAVMFRPSTDAASIPVGTVAHIEGTVTSYRGRRRVSVERLSAAERWDPADLLGEGNRPAEEALAEFRSLAASVRDRGLRSVLRRVFGDEVFLRRFSECPASQGQHHVIVAGLLEHTISVASLCDSACVRYHGMDRDLLLTAALLHDVGRVDELAYSAGVSRTDEGRLLGHVTLGLRRIHDAAGRSPLDDGRRARLEHAIAAHHGEAAGGVAARTAEALLLQQIDRLDTVADGFSGVVAAAARADESWTDAANPFGRELMLGGMAGDGADPHTGLVVPLSA